MVSRHGFGRAGLSKVHRLEHLTLKIMKYPSFKRVALGLLAVMAMASLASCDMMKQDLEDCPYGLYLQFKYDYNLQRADMFNDHVGAVDVYVFDERGRYVKTQSEENTANYAPLADPNYRMHMELEPGKYQFIVLAGQDSYSQQMARQRAHFMRTEMKAGDPMTAMEIKLDTQGGNVLTVDNMGAPLDTLWHGMETIPVEVFAEKPTYHTISLMRDTKKINVTLRELDDPSQMDIQDYDLAIYDRNTHLWWDNAVDESQWAVYTPHATWNTDDLTQVVTEDGEQMGYGKIGHADFMTSRIMYHGNAAQDGRLEVTYRPTGEKVINVNLPDLLSRLRNYEDYLRYGEQEFLDRGYDYQLDFFLKGGELQYVNISISVLSWSIRVQFEELGH